MKRIALFVLLACTGSLCAEVPRGADAPLKNRTPVVFQNSWWFNTSTAGTLWRTDGTAHEMVKVGNESITSIAATSTHLYSLTASGKLYATSTSVDEAQLVAELPAWVATPLLVPHGDLLYFSYRAEPKSASVWRSDGTAAGTYAVASFSNINPYYSPIVDTAARASGGLFYFSVEDGVPQLWRSDGTTAGTVKLDNGGYLYAAGFVGDRLYYSNYGHLWSTDGTVDGTHRVLHYGTVIGSTNEQLYVVIDARVRRLDPATGVVHDVPPNLNDPHESIADGNRIFLFATGVVAITDGTSEATQVILLPGRAQGQPILIGGIVYFLLVTDQNEAQLWRTDGTRNGTKLVQPFGKIQQQQRPGDLSAIGNRFLFVAQDATYGAEPWISDGTAGGTRMNANLGKEGRLEGSVIDAATHQPIRDAVISIFRYPNSEEIPVNADGTYAIEDLIPDHYRLVARSNSGSYIPIEWPDHDCVACAGTILTLRAVSNETRVADFALPRSGKIAGLIRDAHGEPVAGIEVRVAETYPRYYGANQPALARAVSDARGRFETNTPLPRDRSLLVFTTDYNGYSGVIYPNVSCSPGCGENTGTRIQVSSAETRELDFTVRPWPIVQGRLLDGVTGKPIDTSNFGFVAVGNRWSWDEYLDSPVTGNEYSIPLRDGTSVVFEQRHGAPSYRARTLTYPQRPLPGETLTGNDLTLQPIGARVAGRVTDAKSSAPIHGIDVRIVTKGGIGAASVVTAADGSYATSPSLDPGDYAVQVLGNEEWFGTEEQTQFFTLAKDEFRSGVDLQLERTASVTGLVVDAVTREPLIGVELELQGTHGELTNHRGRYDLAQLRPGTYTLTATKPGWQSTTQTIAVPATGAKITRNIAMQPLCAPVAAAAIEVAGAGRVATIALGDTCTRCAFTPSPFIHVTRACGMGEVTYRVEPNLTGEKREGRIVLPGQVIVVRQSKR